MQESPHMMLQMASLLWFLSSQQEAAAHRSEMLITVVPLGGVPPVPGMVFSGTSSILISLVSWDLGISANYRAFKKGSINNY